MPLLKKKYQTERNKAKQRAAASSTPAVINYAANGLRTAAEGVGQLLDLVLIQGIKNYGRNYVFTALSQLGGPVGALAGWMRYKNYDSMNKFSPEVRKELLNDFSTSYSSDYTKPAIEIADKYEACFKARVINLSTFGDITTPDKEKLSVKLANIAEPKVLAITDSIKNALSKSNMVADARANLHGLKVNLQHSKMSFSPAVVACVTEEYHDAATRSLSDQLEAEKANIRDLFNNTPPDEDFVQNLKDTLGAGTTDIQIEQIRDDMLKSLDDAHQKATTPVQDPKQIPDLIGKLKKEAERAADELFLISLLYSEGSESMRASIKALMESASEVTISTDPDDAEQSELKGVTLKKLGSIEALSAQRISISADGSCSLSTPSSWHWYHQNPDQQLIADLMLMALTAKVLNPEKITLYVDDACDKEDKAGEAARLDMARQFYKAARLMGWPRDKITIKVNGEEMSAVKLYGGNPQTVEDQADAWETARQKNAKENQQALVGTFKTQISHTRLEEEKKAAAEPPAAAGPRGPRGGGR